MSNHKAHGGAAAFALSLGLLVAAPAAAQELRELCADRPGAGTPTCTVDKGHFQIEIGAFSVERDRQGATVTDTYSAADIALRFGVTDRAEIQAAVSPFVTVRERHRITGDVDRTRGAGDLTLAVRQSLGNPEGLSFALQPYVTAPTGSRGIGADSWQYGLIVPLAVDLSPGVSLGLTGQVAAAPDIDGSGHHVAYSAVVGLSRGFGPLALGVELTASVDDDPAGATTQSTFELSGSWVPAGQPNLQLDAGLSAGLNDDTPDLTVYGGLSRRF